MFGKNRWVAFLLVTILALCFGLVSIGQVEAQKRYKMALLVKNLVNPFWIYMKEGAEAVAKDLGVELVTLAPIKPDNLDEQMRMMEDLIEKKIDAIVLVPVDSRGIIPAIEKANKAGIPVATANTRAFGGKVVTFSAIENYDAAKIIARYMIEKLGGKGKVIILEGVPAAQTAIDRKKGFDDSLKEAPGIVVLASQTAMFRRAEGMAVMENLLQRFPEVDAVLAANDEMALGAIEAIDAAGKRGKILVSGFDANADAVRAVAEGKLLVTMDQRPGDQAGKALEAAVKYLRGESVPERVVIEATLVDKSNVDTYLKKYGIKK